MWLLCYLPDKLFVGFLFFIHLLRQSQICQKESLFSAVGLILNTVHRPRRIHSLCSDFFIYISVVNHVGFTQEYRGSTDFTFLSGILPNITLPVFVLLFLPLLEHGRSDERAAAGVTGWSPQARCLPVQRAEQPVSRVSRQQRPGLSLWDMAMHRGGNAPYLDRGDSE